MIYGVGTMRAASNRKIVVVSTQIDIMGNPEYNKFDNLTFNLDKIFDLKC